MYACAVAVCWSVAVLQYGRANCGVSADVDKSSMTKDPRMQRGFSR